MNTEELLEGVLHGEEMEGVTYNAFGFTVRIAGKTITGLTLDEAKEILEIHLPTVQESKG